MDASNDTLPESEQNSSFLMGLSTLLSMFLWLIGLDTFTPQEHQEAGIDLSGEGRDE